MSQPIALVDLDDTLFQTVGKCPGGTGEGLRLMSRLVDGSPSGYATQTQQNLLSWLRMGKVIPVTARSRDVLARVDIEQAPAICSNGGCIIAPGGAIDRAWHDHLVTQAQTTDPIADVYGVLTADLDKTDYRHWIVDENDLPLFIVVKTNGADHGVLADLSAASADRLPAGWRKRCADKHLQNREILPLSCRQARLPPAAPDARFAFPPSRLEKGSGAMRHHSREPAPSTAHRLIASLPVRPDAAPDCTASASSQRPLIRLRSAAVLPRHRTMKAPREAPRSVVQPTSHPPDTSER